MDNKIIKLEDININKILNRDKISKDIENFLLSFEMNKKDLSILRGIFLYGSAGSGKTYFILNILKQLNYDVILYDAGDMRNKNIIELIAKHNMSDKNVISMFTNNQKKIAIVMDEIDGMNNGDKGGINSLIKMIRPKKTKKQKLEEIALIPIICIGNYQMDKKMKELMKICLDIELNKPNNKQINEIIKYIMPNINKTLTNKVNDFIDGDIRKLKIIHDIYNSNNKIIDNNMLNNILNIKSYNDDAKQVTKNIINNNYSIQRHNQIMNETERTIVALLWHENIADILQKVHPNNMINLYLKILENICLADYIDRITFQKQIWQFNEMSSLIKTFYNNKIIHDNINNINHKCDIRFTKILTKYSTEFNNKVFIQNLCQELMLDKKDMMSYLLFLKNKYTDDSILDIFKHNAISKLDIQRIYRYISNFTKNNDNNELPEYE